MSGYHCKHCGAIRHIADIGYCCKASQDEHEELFALILMRDPVQREGYTETRSNEKDEEELWRLVDGEA